MRTLEADIISATTVHFKGATVDPRRGAKLHPVGGRLHNEFAFALDIYLGLVR